MDRIQTGEEMAGNSTKTADIDYNGAQNQTKPRHQTRGTAQLAAGVHLLPTGGIFKSAAVEVLRREQRLMATGEICKLALEWGLLKCSGKTPEATMASSLYGDIKRNDGTSLFFRPSGGMFGLKEWVDQGLFLPPPEAVNAPISQQRDSDSDQKRKRQRKGTNNASKRQQRGVEPPPLPPSPAEQPRQRLLTSESNEASGPSTVTEVQNTSLSLTTHNAAGSAVLQRQDWIQSALIEQENKVAAVENKWGPLHPRAGQAHLLLYQAFKQHAVRFPLVESRAQTALTRAYDIMMFNSQVEELGKLQGVW